MIQVAAVLIKQHLSLSPPNVHGIGIRGRLPYREVNTRGRGGLLEKYIVSHSSCPYWNVSGTPIAKVLIPTRPNSSRVMSAWSAAKESQDTHRVYSSIGPFASKMSLLICINHLYPVSER